jgi:GT2 family glycosyltransferase
MVKPRVSVTIVTFNSARYIQRCLDAVLRQADVHLDVLVVDNASTDGTLEALDGFRGLIRVIRNPDNTGFATAQNQAIAASDSPWVLALNPDVLMTDGFVRELVDAAGLDPRAGSVCGKLLRIGPGFEPLPERRIDSAGIYFTPAMRHFDRGWHERDEGQYEILEYVFGASAAAALYRRSMIEEVSYGGEFFDSDFFAYREDADVAWRAQLLGWRAIYTPSAVGYHVRTVSSGNRRAISPLINMHSVKNRFLLRTKNLTLGLLRRHWLAMTIRDLVVVGGCVLSEPRSLQAFWLLASHFRRALEQRRWIMRQRVAPDTELARWFRFQPASQPLEAPVTIQAGSVLSRSHLRAAASESD